MKVVALATLAVAAALACTARAEDAVLATYEPNTIGVTKDSDDVGFLDVKLSLIYPLMPTLIGEVFHDQRLYFAATARFAQYLGTRESSPVVGKRFNPKLIWRKFMPGGSALDYVDFAYAHESNGQSINSPEEFNFEAQRQVADGGKAEFAKDFISRGWDYLEVTTRHAWEPSKLDDYTLYGSFRYFLKKGLLQGQAEEYNDWENDPEGKPRKEVNGLAVFFKYRHKFDGARRLTDAKLGLGLETGYSRPFRYNTVRAEASIKVLELPLMLFYQNGYNSDLALYYKRVSTVGLALELGSF